MIKRTILLSAALMLPACAIAPGMTEQEKQVRDDIAVDKYMPASRVMRDNIETQELFAQAAFWGHEYDLNPGDLEAAIKLAAAVRKLGNPDRAIEITQTTRALYPRDPYLIAEYGAALIASERATDAVPVIDEGLQIAPGYGRLWSLKGAALDQMENYAAARQHYQRALQITPNDASVLANMGLSFALQGDPVTAEQWLRRASAQPGAGAGVHQNLALVLQLQGRTKEAEVAANRARLSKGDQMMPPPPVPALRPRIPARQTAHIPQAAPRQAAPRQAAPRQAAPQPSARAQRAQSRLRGYEGGRGSARPTQPNFNSASEAARAAAAQGTARSAPVQPAPIGGEMNAEQRSVLDQISQALGPRSASGQTATQAKQQAASSAPRVVGPQIPHAAQQARPMPQGQPSIGYPAVPGLAGAQPDRRAPARRRR